MSKYYETRQFKALQKQWYDRLNEEGFVDEELFSEEFGNHNTTFLKRPGFKWVNKWDPAIVEHFRLARNFLAHGTFASKIDEKIWQLHSEGYSIREIVSKLNQEDIKISTFPVFTKLKYLKIQMFIFNRTHPEGLRIDTDE
jgi:hypothetical protein